MDEIRILMDKTKNIRNICVIGHKNHGKTTLINSLLSRAGIIIPQRDKQDITMKSRYAIS